MSLPLSLLILLILVMVAWQDFKYRAITWLYFPLLALFIVLEIYFATGQFFGFFFFINLLFVIIQLLLITLYLSLKKREFIRIWHNYLGIGDIYFFVILCLIFSPVNFILFYLLSLVLSVAIATAMQVSGNSFRLIPLAGIQSVLLALLLAAKLFIGSIDLRTDINLNGLM
jgi:hypothetical protein